MVGTLKPPDGTLGLLTLPNDVARWGPWAQKIITGNENASKIYAIATNGVVTEFFLGIDPEDFDIIPANADLYVPDPGNGRILKVPRTFFTNYVGDLLITQAGEYSNPRYGQLFHSVTKPARTGFSGT